MGCFLNTCGTKFYSSKNTCSVKQESSFCKDKNFKAHPKQIVRKDLHPEDNYMQNNMSPLIIYFKNCAWNNNSSGNFKNISHYQNFSVCRTAKQQNIIHWSL